MVALVLRRRRVGARRRRRSPVGRRHHRCCWCRCRRWLAATHRAQWLALELGQQGAGQEEGGALAASDGVQVQDRCCCSGSICRLGTAIGAAMRQRHAEPPGFSGGRHSRAAHAAAPIMRARSAVLHAFRSCRLPQHAPSFRRPAACLRQWVRARGARWQGDALPAGAGHVPSSPRRRAGGRQGAPCTPARAAAAAVASTAARRSPSAHRATRPHLLCRAFTQLAWQQQQAQRQWP